MKSAIYNQEGKPPLVLVVHKEHADGTVDIGPKDEASIVTKCPVSKEPKHGHATIEEPAKK